MEKTGGSFSYNLHRPGCSCCNSDPEGNSDEITRRQFMKVSGAGVLGALVLPGLTWAGLSAGNSSEGFTDRRKPLVVKPVFSYEIPERRTQTSWRNWGGIQTEKDAVEEIARINGELKSFKTMADFPVEFLPVSGVRSSGDLNNLGDTGPVDLFLVYAAGGGMDRFDTLNKTGKDIIFFCRQKSGPVYLWYEIISPRYLRQHTDVLTVQGIDENDVVIDSQDELLWRFRALCGLKNTIGSGILAIGGPGAWSQPLDIAMKSVEEKFKLDIRTISYEELGNLISEARKDDRATSRAKNRASEYLQIAGTKLETRREFVENCFLLEDVFIRLMDKFNFRAITVNNCMGTIMPLAESTACLTLSLLNDAGYLAFCESDFIIIPSGILLANISGKPVFLNDPTYPHDKTITLAHCTAPRRMDGKNLEPARILTHFESDYGAAPKVEMKIGQIVTNIMADFAFRRNIGLTGKIIDNPMLDICRSQIDVRFECDSKKVAEHMPGFHWITAYGDYTRETGYALKKTGIGFENLI
jgi:hypothetical protein